MKRESECGFGVCAGDPACRDTKCPGHPAQQGFPVIDHKFIDAQLRAGDPAEFIRSVEADASRLKTAAFAVALALALAYILYITAI